MTSLVVLRRSSSRSRSDRRRAVSCWWDLPTGSVIVWPVAILTLVLGLLPRRGFRPTRARNG